MVMRSIVFLFVLMSQMFFSPTSLKSSDGDDQANNAFERPRINKSFTEEFKKNKQKKIRKQLQKDQYACLVLRIINEAEENKRAARSEEDSKNPFIQDALEASSNMYKNAIETRRWFKEHLEAQEVDKRKHIFSLVKSIGGLEELPEDLQKEVYNLGILTQPKLLSNLASWIPESLNISSSHAKGLLFAALTLGGFAATVASECSIPPGSYKDTCRNFEVDSYKSPYDTELPGFCKLRMSCQSDQGSWVPNTVFIQEGMEKCVTEYGENCGGLFTTRSTPTRLCTSSNAIKNEKERLSKESRGFAAVDCSSQVTPPSECKVEQGRFYPLDSNLPPLCRYNVRCATTISETKGTPEINIRHDITASQQVYLPSNAKGCLQDSINRVRESLDGRTDTSSSYRGNSPSSYKDEL